jgi:hypothetical protein
LLDWLAKNAIESARPDSLSKPSYFIFPPGKDFVGLVTYFAKVSASHVNWLARIASD